MASPHGILNGTEIKVYDDTKLIAYATSGTLSINQATRERTNRDSGGWNTTIEVIREFSVSLDGMYAWAKADGSSIKNADYLYDKYIRTTNPLTIAFGTTDGQSDDVKYYGTARLVSLSMTGSTEESATFSASFEGSGELVYEQS